MKVDEDLPRLIADTLNACGHDAATVLGQGMGGATDDLLWTHVQGEQRWLITADKGFADLRQHPPGSHAGVILLRPSEESRRAYTELATAAFEQLNLEQLVGAVVVVTDRGIRVRRASGSLNQLRPN
jgi:predicted nuclease of predicted toxin-antitoxin system